VLWRHAARLGDLGVFLNAVQNITDDPTSTPLAVIGVGLPSTTGIMTKADTVSPAWDR